MEIQSVFNAPSTSTQTGAKSNDISTDFETFLQMLTVQMQHQDPLNPVESTDFSVQLATFSTLEQQALTNEILQSFQQGSEATPIGALQDWVGLDVSAKMPIFYSGTPVTVEVGEAAQHSDLILNFYDKNGQRVSQEWVPPNKTTVQWAPETGREGQYRAEVQRVENGEVIETFQPSLRARVKEAVWAGGQTELIFDGELSIPSTQITAARSAPE